MNHRVLTETYYLVKYHKKKCRRRFVNIVSLDYKQEEIEVVTREDAAPFTLKRAYEIAGEEEHTVVVKVNVYALREKR